MPTPAETICQHSQERTHRIRNRNDEGVLQARRDVDAFRDQQVRNPGAESVEGDGLRKIEDRHDQRAFPVWRT
jgi:hypothetical protein